jgi:hypothetical protein
MRSGRSWRPAGSPTATSACCSHHPAGKLEAGTVLVVALTALHPAVPQPAGSLVYELV